MSITTLPRTVNRTVLDVYLQGLRLPLTAVEHVAGKTEEAAWPPAVAFDSFEAQVKTVVGSVWRDDELVEQGRILKAKVTQLAEAERLEAQAEAKRAEAEDQLQQRREAAARERELAEERAQQREQAIERDKAVKEQRAAKATQERKATAAKTDELRERVLTTQERAAKRRSMEAEAEALEERTEALQAEKAATNVDRALQAKKAQRRVG